MQEEGCYVTTVSNWFGGRHTPKETSSSISSCMLLCFYSHPGCNCQTGFNGAHCEFIAGQEPTATPPDEVVANPSQTNASDPDGGRVVGLAVALLALVAIIGIALVRRQMRKKTGKEADTGSGAPMQEPEEMEGGGRSIATAVETEEAFVGSTSAVNTSPRGNLQTVEIL